MASKCISRDDSGCKIIVSEEICAFAKSFSKTNKANSTVGRSQERGWAAGDLEVCLAEEKGGRWAAGDLGLFLAGERDGGGGGGIRWQRAEAS